jgi:hypothetical protein
MSLSHDTMSSSLTKLMKVYSKGKRKADGKPPRNMYPVHRSDFNLREIAKEMLLLERHLTTPRQHCFDCIRKHFFQIEAFADEAVQLDSQCKTGARFQVLAEQIAAIAQYWNLVKCKTRNFEPFAQQIRAIRKSITREAFNLELDPDIRRLASKWHSSSRRKKGRKSPTKAKSAISRVSVRGRNGRKGGKA